MHPLVAVKTGLFGDGDVPDASSVVDVALMERIHDDTAVIWPAAG